MSYNLAIDMYRANSRNFELDIRRLSGEVSAVDLFGMTYRQYRTSVRAHRDLWPVLSRVVDPEPYLDFIALDLTLKRLVGQT